MARSWDIAIQYVLLKKKINFFHPFKYLGFSKIVDKAPNIRILYLDENKLAHSKELDNISKLALRELKLDGNPFTANFQDGSDYSWWV